VPGRKSEEVTLTTFGAVIQSYVDQGVLPRNVIALVGRPKDADGDDTRARPEDLHKHWWARTVSNRRPLVCKSEPDCPVRSTRCHSVLECPAQRLVRVHSVHGLSGCVYPSWHTLGTTGA
jgi:hypothetical protein